MAKFGETSAKRLSSCHPDLQELFMEVVQEFDCTILCGHRTEAEQDKAVHDGHSKVEFPNSKHNGEPSMAVDVAPWNPSAPQVRWNDTAGFYYFAGYVKRTAENLGVKIRWGGDWDRDNDTQDQSFMDLPHFELIT